MELLFAFMRLMEDLKLHAPGQDPVAVITNWVYSEEGQKIIGDLDEILRIKNIPLRIAVVKQGA